VKASFEQVKHALAEAGRQLSVAILSVPQRIEALKGEAAGLERQLAERSAAGPLSGDRLLESAEEIGGATVVITEVPGVEANLMRQLIDQVRGKTTSSAVLLASRQGEDKVTLVAGISKDLQAKKLSAGEWIRPVAAAVGGGGGGRPDLAQAGGKEPAKLPEALQLAKETIRKMLAG
jgi:alanyl-tRNA synthetase